MSISNPQSNGYLALAHAKVLHNTLLMYVCMYFETIWMSIWFTQHIHSVITLTIKCA